MNCASCSVRTSGGDISDGADRRQGHRRQIVQHGDRYRFGAGSRGATATCQIRMSHSHLVLAEKEKRPFSEDLAPLARKIKDDFGSECERSRWHVHMPGRSRWVSRPLALRGIPVGYR